ncbi:MAG: zinc-dependent alcohol dehydrogenase family protein [Actinomycetota bacterium]
MRAWELSRPGPIHGGPLEFVDKAPPEPSAGEVRVRVAACGVCRTDLHIVEGDLPEHRPRVVPGHQAVGMVDALGPGAHRFGVGDRIGIAWLRHTCGRCRFCTRGLENLCTDALFTGWDADGGYAEYAVVPESFAYAIPAAFDDEHAAPLLCAGIIGYRALKKAGVGEGVRLGIYGFGSSAHIACQVAAHLGARVHVVTRSERARKLATRLGAVSARPPEVGPPEPLEGAVLFAPSGDVVPPTLAGLDRGGTLAIAGIHLSRVPPLDYERHLFGERTITSVMANTRADGEELLEIASRIPVETTTTAFALADADNALRALSEGALAGAAVLVM